MIYATYLILASILSQLPLSAETTTSRKDIEKKTDSPQTQSQKNKIIQKPISQHWSQTYYQSGEIKSPQEVKPLKIYQTPKKNAEIVANLTVEKGFEVEQGDWVKITSEDGKVHGWALAEEVKDNINHSYMREYKVIINGPSEHYKVTKISPQEMKKAQEERLKKRTALLAKQEKEIAEHRKNWQKFHQNHFASNAWINQFFAEDDQGLSDEEVKSLQSQLAKLQKEVNELKESQKSK